MAKGGRRSGAGRRPTPTALRVLKGGARKKSASSEPNYEAHPLEAPARLSDEERQVWQRIVPLVSTAGVFTVGDEEAAVLLCQAIADHERLRRTVIEEGDTVRVTTEHGETIRAHPATRLMSDAWRRAEAMLAHFGLTPSARTKVKVEPKKPADPVEEWRRKHGLS